MFFGTLTIDINGFLLVLGSFNHWFQWFSMVRDHWWNDGMVSMDRYTLFSKYPPCLPLTSLPLLVFILLFHSLFFHIFLLHLFQILFFFHAPIVDALICIFFFCRTFPKPLFVYQTFIVQINATLPRLPFPLLNCRL